jgi:predicted PurR-regulated permease PerM
MDLLLWGLLARKTGATVTAQDWKDSPAAAERMSEKQAVTIQRETARIQAISGSIFESLGLATGLTGTGFVGLALAFMLKNQATLRAGLDRAVAFGERLKTVKPGKETEDVEKEFRELPENPALKKSLAKVKKTSKVS